MQLFKERSFVHPLARQEFRKDRRYEQFVSLIEEPWDDKRPGDHDKEGGLVKGTNYSHFKDKYNGTVADDEQEIETIKKSEGYGEKTPLGEIGEYLVMEGIENLRWLAGKVKVLPTHEFDDIKRGTDFVIRFESDKGTNFYLGVDVTTSQSPAMIKGKKQNVFNALYKGELTELKYFEDPDRKLKGELKAIKGKKTMPKIAMVLDPADAEQMLYIILRMKRRESLSPEELENLLPEEKALIAKDKKELEFVQAKVKKDIIEQLKANVGITEYHLNVAAEIAKKTGNNELLKKYEKSYNAYTRVYEKIKKEA